MSGGIELFGCSGGTGVEMVFASVEMICLWIRSNAL